MSFGWQNKLPGVGYRVSISLTAGRKNLLFDWKKSNERRTSNIQDRMPNKEK
jgi:hypothetical protein